MKKLLIGLFILGGVIITSTFSSYAYLAPTYTEEKSPSATQLSWRSTYPVKCSQIVFSYTVKCDRRDWHAIDAANNSKTVVTEYFYYTHLENGILRYPYVAYDKTTTTQINGSTHIFKKTQSEI